MPRKQKHYTDELMITNDIDRARKRITRLLKRSERRDNEADELVKTDDGCNSEKIKQMREESKLDRSKAERITETRLKRLQNTLASFRTELLPGMATDNSVVLQRK